MNDVVKYNYDVVVITDKEIALQGYLQPNETMLVQISDEMKNDIEQMKNRNEIIKSIIMNEDLGICIGFNFEGKEYRRNGNIFWRTRVFYYNQTKAWFQNLRK